MLGGVRKSVYGKTKAEAREKYEELNKQYDEGLDLGAPPKPTPQAHATHP